MLVQRLYVQPKLEQRLGDECAPPKLVAQSGVILWSVAGLNNLTPSESIWPFSASARVELLAN